MKYLTHSIRGCITKLLIKVAMKTCTTGYCYDHLELAYTYEENYYA